MSQRATASGRTSASPSPWRRGAGTSCHSSLPGPMQVSCRMQPAVQRGAAPGKRSLCTRNCGRRNRIRLRQRLDQPVAQRPDAGILQARRPAHEVVGERGSHREVERRAQSPVARRGSQSNSLDSATPCPPPRRPARSTGGRSSRCAAAESGTPAAPASRATRPASGRRGSACAAQIGGLRRGGSPPECGAAHRQDLRSTIGSLWSPAHGPRPKRIATSTGSRSKSA